MAGYTEEDTVHRGQESFTNLSMQAGAVGDTEIAAAAGIQAMKLQHQHALQYNQADGAAIVAAIMPIHVVRGVAATIVAVQVSCVDAPSGGTIGFNVDLKKANVGTPAPASVLNAMISYSATQTDCEVEVGVVDLPTLAAGDTLLVVVAIDAGTGTQGEGLIVTVTLREDAD